MVLFSPLSALGDFLCCLLLFFGLQQTNFFHVLLYMVFCLFDTLSLFSIIGYMIQTSSFSVKSSSGAQVKDEFIIGFMVFTFVFYITGIYFSFQAYKEFKAMH
jgi:hypothetical protein